MFEAVALVLWLFLFLGIWYAYGNICIAPIFLETTAEVIVAAVYRTGTAFTGYEIMAVRGFGFITADIAANGIIDNQYESSFVKSSCIRCAP